MIKGKNIICISSIDWDFLWQGHQEIMATFAKNGNRVLFIENTGVRHPNLKDIQRVKKRLVSWFKSTKGFRKEMENLYVYSPVALPFPYSNIARWVNRYLLIRPLRNWINIVGFHEPIIWTFLPTGIALDIINSIEKKILVYYCIADFYKLVAKPEKVKKKENELITMSDLIFAQGRILSDRCKRLSPNVHIFPFGVNIETFENFEYIAGKVPDDIRGIKKPIIGYIGGVHRHIDFRLLKYIAERHMEWSIALLGPVQADVGEISNLQNIFLLGKKDFSELPHYINEFDACIIPYSKTEYTATVYPTKLNEYHALGKPVVSTDLPEIIEFNKENGDCVFIGRTYEEFTRAISTALKSSNDSLIEERIASARKNSWARRIEEMSCLIEKEIEIKERDKAARWKANLLAFYKKATKKIIYLGVIIVCLYVLLFNTAFFWFAAKPLRISESPARADAIVVFGGGVGETGSPGNSTIERARYSVDLYKKGYANNIIFSSGYIYMYNDAENMKLFAISMGVPEKNIILEEKANSTYENVLFTKEILGKNKWSSVLLVSSPYNMRRAALVFGKIANNVKVIYTPVEKSQFYDRVHGEKFEQIKAIMHEYLGIVYYLFKRYI